MSRIYRVSALDSNYIWMIQPDTTLNQVWVIDPGEAAPVLNFLTQNRLEPIAILITHRHKDHTGGINELLTHFSIPVYGPDCEAIPQITHPLYDNSTFSIGNIPCEAIATPGHTLDHLSYLCRPEGDDAWLFCGDTLFGAGCGRLFEGTPEQSLDSIDRLAALPDNTLMYCAHEYTRANLRFALHVEPDNKDTVRRFQQAEALRDDHCTLPSTIALEKQTNPFLRLHSPSLIEQVEQFSGHKMSTRVEVFAALRGWKDHF